MIDPVVRTRGYFSNRVVLSSSSGCLEITLKGVVDRIGQITYGKESVLLNRDFLTGILSCFYAGHIVHVRLRVTKTFCIDDIGGNK